MTNLSPQIIEQLVGDRDLVFRFFAFFSRFEYALKRAKFLKPGSSNQAYQAEPDWDKYADELRGQFAKVDDGDFKAAYAYLRSNPPKKQVVKGNQINWNVSRQDKSESDEKYILRLVRTVRNNLFHGGKYPSPVGPVGDVGRNNGLLESCIVVLDRCLILSPDVQKIFSEVI